MKLCRFLISIWILAGITVGVAPDSAFGAKKKKKAPRNRTMSTSKVKSLLREVSTELANCEQEDCEEKKQLQEFQQVLKDLLDAKVKNNFLTEENRLLKGASRRVAGIAALNNRGGCFKKHVLKDLMMNHGVTENGGAIYSKKPVGEVGAVCWSNSKKKREATVTFCSFPLAIKIQTRGGDEIVPAIREREYFFDKDACNLVAVRVFEQNKNGKTETNMTYDMCKKQWGKRTADASMTPTEIRRMEDIIGFCFRYSLLPPREDTGGKTNPNYTAPNMPVGSVPASNF